MKEHHPHAATFSLLLGGFVFFSYLDYAWWNAPFGIPKTPCWFFLIALVVLVVLRSPKTLLPRDPGDGILLLLGLTLILGTVQTGRLEHLRSYRDPVAILKGVGVAYLLYRILSDFDAEKVVWRASLWAAGLVVAVAVLQLVLFTTTGYFFTFKTGQFAGISPGRWTAPLGLPAVSSVFSDPRYFSIRLSGLAGLLWGTLLFLRSPSRAARWTWGVLFLGITFLIYLNFTRSAVLAHLTVLYAGLLIFLYQKSITAGRIFLILGAAVVVVFLFSPLANLLLSLESRSLAERVALWQRYFQNLGFWGAPLPGENLSPHSLPLALLFYAGIPGIAVWLALWGYLLGGFLCNPNRPGFPLFLTFFLALVGYEAGYLFFSGYGHFNFWVLVAASLSLRKKICSPDTSPSPRFGPR